MDTIIKWLTALQKGAGSIALFPTVPQTVDDVYLQSGKDIEQAWREVGVSIGQSMQTVGGEISDGREKKTP